MSHTILRTRTNRPNGLILQPDLDLKEIIERRILNIPKSRVLEKLNWSALIFDAKFVLRVLRMYWCIMTRISSYSVFWFSPRDIAHILKGQIVQAIRFQIWEMMFFFF